MLIIVLSPSPQSYRVLCGRVGVGLAAQMHELVPARTSCLYHASREVWRAEMPEILLEGEQADAGNGMGR